MAVNRAWFYTKLASAAVLLSAALFMFALSSGLAPCNRVFAQSTSCNVGDTEVFTGATEFQGVVEVGATPSAGSAGQYLVSSGASTPPEWSEGPVSVAKPADETVNNSTTLQNDDDLVFAVTTNATYQVEGLLFMNSASAADFKYQFTIPASATLNGLLMAPVGIGNFDESAATAFQTSGVDQVLRITFVVVTAGTSGNVQLQWAQNVMDATDTKLLKGSNLVYTRQN